MLDVELLFSLMMFQLKVILSVAYLLFSCVFAQHQPQIEQKIANGHDAQLGQFPYYVFLRVLLKEKENICGGALISNKFILTSGQCLHNAQTIQVHLGALSIVALKESGRKTVHILPQNINEHVFVHPKFSASLDIK